MQKAIIPMGGLALTACGPGGSSGGGGDAGSFWSGDGGGSGGGGGSGPGGGSGGGGSTSYDAGAAFNETDEYATRMIAATTLNMLTFLWNRDMPTAGSSRVENVSMSGPCLLTGSYTASGTVTWLASGCTGNGGPDLTYTLAACEHDDGQVGESVIISGAVEVRSQSVHAGSCSKPESASETITGTGLNVIFRRAGSDTFERVFESCSVELNYAAREKPTGSARQKPTTRG
jgi:hypothetical protein